MQTLVLAFLLLLGGTVGQWPCWQCPPPESGDYKGAALKRYGDICTECPARCNITCAARCQQPGHDGYKDAATCGQYCTEACYGKCSFLAGEGTCE